MEKIASKFRKITIYHLLAFFIPVFVFLILYACAGIFNGNLFLHSDAVYQYYGTFMYFKDAINGSNTFPYTFSSGLGGTMYGAFFYLLSSPLNIIIFLIDDLVLALFIITLIKIGISGLNMFIYLNKKLDKKKSLIFSLCYSLSSYMILYHCNIMWLDAMMFAPLVIYGVENIIDNNNDLMYIIFAFLTLLSNYYMGYIVCLFSFIYFFYYLYINNDKKHFIKDNKKLIIRFILIDIFLALSISFILIPIYFESTNFLRPSNNKIFNLIFLDVFADSYIGTGTLNNPVNRNMILSYAGVLIYILLIYYLFDKKENKKEKKAFIIVLLLFILPVFIVPLNKIWHLFSYPAGFNYRYSFLYLIFVLPKLAQVLEKIKYSKVLFKCFLVYIILTIYFLVLNIINPFYYNNVNGIKEIEITFILISLNLYLLKKNKQKYLLYVLLFDLLLNISFIFYKSTYGDKRILESNYNNTHNALKNIDNNYRVGMLNTISYNDSMIYGYHGISSFNSNTNYRSVKIPIDYYKINKLDNANYNHYYYYGYNTIIDTILGIKYIGNDRINNNYKIIDEYDAGGKRYLMENEYAFSLGFLADSNIKNYKISSSVFYINDLLNAISGSIDDYFIPIEITKIDDNKYIIYDFDKYNDYVVVFDGKLKGNYNPYNNYRPDIDMFDGFYILYNDRKEEIYTLEFSELNSDIKIYTYDIDKFNNFVKSVSQLNLVSNNGNNIEGNIDALSDGVLVLTIPYEDGWNIYVDNKKVDYFEVMGGFIGIDIKEGNHNIKLYYKTPYLKLSIIISIISFLSLIGLEIFYFKRKKVIL